MLWSLLDRIGGWKEVRSRGGFSYQVSRSGKRRIVPNEGRQRPELCDEQWVQTGLFADDAVVSKYGKFHVSQHHRRQRDVAAA